MDFGNRACIVGVMVSFVFYLQLSSAVIFFLLTNKIDYAEAVVLPTFLWDPVNPLFNQTMCPGGNELQVQVNDLLNVMCPSRAMNNIVMDNIRNNDAMYENIWFTDDEAAAKSCDTVNAQHLFDCNKPYELMYYGISFRPRPSKASFDPGKKYFFYGTSDGSQLGLKYKSGGHCRTHNMLLAVYVCHFHEKCNRTTLYSCADATVTEVKYVRSPNFAERDGGNIMGRMSNGVLSICFIALFFIGLAVGLMLKVVIERYRRKYVTGSPGSLGLVSPSKSLYSEPETNGNCNRHMETCVLENENDVNKQLRVY